MPMPRRLCLGLFVLLLIPAAQAQPDTTATAPAEARAHEPLPSPRGALLRSLAVPGWGQFYNGDYLKIPVVVGGLGTLVASVVVQNNHAILYRRAAIYADCSAPTPPLPPSACEGFPSYQDEYERAGSPSASAARSIRDTARRNRDLLILVSVLAYALQALDAYVSAHLADFDVSEDLSLQIAPTPVGPAATLRWQF